MWPFLAVPRQARALCLLAIFCVVATEVLARPDVPPNFAPTVVFTQAEFVLSAQPLPPGDDVPWEPVKPWQMTRVFLLSNILISRPLQLPLLFLPHQSGCLQR